MGKIFTFVLLQGEHQAISGNSFDLKYEIEIWNIFKDKTQA